MRLTDAEAGDIAALMALEHRADVAAQVLGWDRQTHAARIADPDMHYLVARGSGPEAGGPEAGGPEAGGPVAGFVILGGLRNPYRNLELVRMAVARPGLGHGRVLLRQALALAFGRHRAHRLWLDVYADNPRARAAYAAVGFVEEGTLREAVCAPDGRWRSLVLMSVLEHEPAARDAMAAAS